MRIDLERSHKRNMVLGLLLLLGSSFCNGTSGTVHATALEERARPVQQRSEPIAELIHSLRAAATLKSPYYLLAFPSFEFRFASNLLPAAKSGARRGTGGISVKAHARGGAQSAAVANDRGVALAIGNGVPRDDLAAVRQFREAAKAGSVVAAANLGLMLGQRRGGRADAAEAAEARRALQLAAKAGIAEAQNNLGVLMLLWQRGPKDDDLEAVAWFKRAASAGLGAGAYNLALASWSGRAK